MEVFKEINQTLSLDIIKQLKIIAEAMLDEHSFEYSTINDGKKCIHIKDKFCIFDAPTLCIYEHNLNKKEYNYFHTYLYDLFLNKFHDKEHWKERIERTSLWNYLKDEDSEYHNYLIEKKVRPDFCLYNGMRKIGIEVTSLTTEDMEIMARSSRQLFQRGLSIDEIKLDMLGKYPKKAKKFDLLIV